MGFINQIKGDIKIIQAEYSDRTSRIKKDDYAFNFWILKNIYKIDEELILDYIVDGSSDGGVDCWYFDEDTKTLFLIQNKYYSTTTTFSKILDSFLGRTIDKLATNTYKHSPALQLVFNKNRESNDFRVCLRFYTTEEKFTTTIKNNFEKWSSEKNIYLM